MRQQNLWAIAVVTFLITGLCASAGGLLSVAWMLVTPAKEPRAIQISSIAPLNTPTTANLVRSPAGLEAAAVYQFLETPEATVVTPSPTPTPTLTPTPLPSPTATVTPTPSPAAAPLPTATPVPVITQGIMRLVVPKLNLDAPVIFSPVKNGTWDVSQLGQAVGHLEGTAPPGSNSNFVLAGHVTLNSGALGPFAHLDQLAPGDTLIVFQGDQQYIYVVDGYQTVNKDTVRVTYPSTSGKITLITCTNWNSAEGRYSDRLVVRGHLFGG